MERLTGFTSKNLKNSTNYWNTQWGIEMAEKTIMEPKKPTTVRQLLNVLNKSKSNINYSISIYHDGEYKDTEDLKEYYWREITWILCFKDKDWNLQYEVAVNSDDTVKQNQIIESLDCKAYKNHLISMLTNFNFQKLSDPGIMETLDWNIDEGEEYHITPKEWKDVTVGYLKKILKEIPDDNVYLYVDSNKYDDRGPYKKLKDIPQKYNNLKITGWTINFWEQWIYCNVSSLYINEDELYGLLEDDFICKKAPKKNTISINDKEDTGTTYNFEAKKDKTTTVEKFIDQININFEKPSYISIDCPKLERTINYQNLHWNLNLSIISDIDLKASEEDSEENFEPKNINLEGSGDDSEENFEPKNYDIKDFKVISWDITIWKNRIYYAISIEPIFEKDWEKK